jgi:hypothetical protein
MAVFWVVAPCSLIEVFQRFRGPCCLGTTTQKTAIFVKKNVLGFRDYIFSMIFNDRPTCRMIMTMISFRARKIDKKMLTFLESPRGNTVLLC